MNWKETKLLFTPQKLVMEESPLDFSCMERIHMDTSYLQLTEL